MKMLNRLFSLLLGAGLPWLILVAGVQAQTYGYGGGGPTQTAEPMSTQEASVTIVKPMDGATLAAGQPVTLQYRIDPGHRGDHIHVYVDGREVAILRRLEGSYVIDPLSPGRHELGIKIVNSAHVPIGVESSITVEAKQP
jgi:hypothetical protein